MEATKMSDYIKIRDDERHEVHVYPYINMDDSSNVLGARFAVFTPTFLKGRNFIPGTNLWIRLDGDYGISREGVTSYGISDFWKDELDHYDATAREQGYSSEEIANILEDVKFVVRSSIPEGCIPAMITPYIRESLSKFSPSSRVSLERALDTLSTLVTTERWACRVVRQEELEQRAAAMNEAAFKDPTPRCTVPTIVRPGRGQVIQFRRR